MMCGTERRGMGSWSKSLVLALVLGGTGYLLGAGCGSTTTTEPARGQSPREPSRAPEIVRPPLPEPPIAEAPPDDVPPPLAPMWRPADATWSSATSRNAAQGRYRRDNARVECAECGDGTVGSCTMRATECRVDCAVGDLRCRQCAPVEGRIAEVCDEQAFAEGLSCEALGYAGGTLTCGQGCLGFDESSCEPCMRSDAVSACVTTRARLPAQVALALAAQDGEVALVTPIHQPGSRCGLELWRFDVGTLVQQGRQTCVVRDAVSDADVVPGGNGAWWVVAAKAGGESAIYRVNDRGARRVAQLAGQAHAFAHRPSPDDPVAVVWHDARGTHLSTLEEARIAATATLPGPFSHYTRTVMTAMPDGFAVLRQSADGRHADVTVYDRTLSLVGGPHALRGTGRTTMFANDIVWTGSRLVAFYQTDDREHAQPLSPMGQAVDAPWSTRTLMRVTSLTQGLSGLAATVGSDPDRPFGLFLVRPLSSPLELEHIASTSRPTLYSVIGLGAGEVIAAWLVPGSRRVRLARARL